MVSSWECTLTCRSGWIVFPLGTRRTKRRRRFFTARSLKLFDAATINWPSSSAPVVISPANLSAFGCGQRTPNVGGYYYYRRRCIFFLFKWWGVALTEEAPRSASLASSSSFTNLPLIEADNGQEQHGEKAITRGKGRKKKTTERKCTAAHAITCVRGHAAKRAPLK